MNFLSLTIALVSILSLSPTAGFAALEPEEPTQQCEQAPEITPLEPAPAAIEVSFGKGFKAYSSEEVIEADRSKMLLPSQRDAILKDLGIKDLASLDESSRDMIFLDAQVFSWDAFTARYPVKQEQYWALRKNLFTTNTNP